MIESRVPTGPADVRDQQWLDQQVAVLGDGIEAAKEIWLNWSDLRCVGRLHPGMTAGDFLASVLGGLRLDVGELVKALPDMSTREIAKVAGVNQSTVVRNRADAFASPDEPPARVVGADGKSYPGRVVREVTAEIDETAILRRARSMDRPGPLSGKIRWVLVSLYNVRRQKQNRLPFSEPVVKETA